MLRILTPRLVLLLLGLSGVIVALAVSLPLRPGEVALIYVADDRDERNLHIISADGSKNAALEQAGSSYFPDCSPDGRQVAFGVFVQGVGHQIEVMHYDGSHRHPVIDPTAFQMDDVPHPTWSPDSEQLAYITGAWGTDDNRLSVVDVAGGVPHTLVTGLENARGVDWSPDGRHFVFVQTFFNRTGNSYSEIFTADPTDPVQTRLTSRQTTTTNPDWSPDGRQIAFSSIGSFSKSTIFVATADGTNLASVIDGGLRVYAVQPAWSPDGTQIAFAALHDSPSLDLFVMNADGSAMRRLTHGDAFESSPCWLQLAPLPRIR